MISPVISGRIESGHDGVCTLNRCEKRGANRLTDTERAEVLADVLRDRAMSTDTEGSKP